MTADGDQRRRLGRRLVGLAAAVVLVGAAREWAFAHNRSPGGFPGSSPSTPPTR